MEIDKRFFRTELLLGRENFERLSNSSIIIIGLGAVGYTAAEVLIRTGVKNLTLVDCDIIEESDFNRHLLGVDKNIGISKVRAAFERLKEINKDASLDTQEGFFHIDNAERIFDKRYDFLIDAIDSLNPKVELIKYCLKVKQPFVSAMGAARRIDPQMIKISTINNAQRCPLLRQIKRRLRKNGIYDDFPVVYSEEEVKGEVTKGKDMYYTRGRIRDILPSSIVSTAVFGVYVAYVAIKFILEQEIKA